MSDTCPNCGAPKYELCSSLEYTEYVCGYAFDTIDDEEWLGKGACEYAASLRSERDRYRSTLEQWRDCRYPARASVGENREAQAQMLRFKPTTITSELHDRCAKYGGGTVPPDCVCDRCEAVREICRLRSVLDHIAASPYLEQSRALARRIAQQQREATNE